ncbi:nitroreductase [Pedobacter sp. BAL39]|uniref:nitroreductase family protein n=1 Tax=Pedobacter sp. BAL39 TaxID=391596 RepID=UPI0001559D59|nr:nitroreductase [Pedobacter sp. BAL39]EDM35299.1 nitroreductase [Pedobacter sp. BAL39]
MEKEIDILTHIIKRRRSIFPASYTAEEIPVEQIQQVLESANYAPTHKLTEPWRFVVFRQAGKLKLAEELARLYKETTPTDKFLQKKYESILEKAAQSSCIITLSAHLNSDKIPEWEELAALACAVQNMALTAEALNIGAYWSSPGMISDLNGFLEMGAQDKCFGLFYMGYHNDVPREAKRTPIEDKVKWVES